jgi:hypothetical protein
MRWSRKRLGSTPAGRRIDFGSVERTGLTGIGRPLQRDLGRVVHRFGNWRRVEVADELVSKQQATRAKLFVGSARPEDSR